MIQVSCLDGVETIDKVNQIPCMCTAAPLSDSEEMAGNIVGIHERIIDT